MPLGVHPELNYPTLSTLVGVRSHASVPCPECSPFRKPAHRRRPVLGIWLIEPGFITYNCVHCGAKGSCHEDRDRRHDAGPERVRMMRARKLATRRHEAGAMRKRSTARWLWHRGQPIDGTLAERYLRDARALTCPLPQTFRYLPATEGYPPALLAPFGMPVEPEPGVIAMPDEHVTGLLSVSLGGMSLPMLK